jgi:hypothetical protein
MNKPTNAWRVPASSAGFKKEWPVLSRSPILTNRSFYEPYHRSVPIPAEGWLSLAGLREIVPGRCLTARPHTPWRRAARAKTRMQEKPWTCAHEKKDRLGQKSAMRRDQSGRCCTSEGFFLRVRTNTAESVRLVGEGGSSTSTVQSKT